MYLQTSPPFPNACCDVWKAMIKLHLRSLPFWDVTQREMVVRYRRFGTICRYHLRRSSSPRIIYLQCILQRVFFCESERSLNSGYVCHDSVQRTFSSNLLSKLFCTVVKRGRLLSNQDINCKFLEENCCKRMHKNCWFRVWADKRRSSCFVGTTYYWHGSKIEEETTGRTFALKGGNANSILRFSRETCKEPELGGQPKKDVRL